MLATGPVEGESSLRTSPVPSHPPIVPLGTPPVHATATPAFKVPTLGKRSPSSVIISDDVLSGASPDPRHERKATSKRVCARGDDAQPQLQLEGCGPMPPPLQHSEAEVWEQLICNHLLELGQLIERGGEGASDEQLERAARIDDLCMLDGQGQGGSRSRVP